jgi:hypothetical protein
VREPHVGSELVRGRVHPATLQDAEQHDHGYHYEYRQDRDGGE